MLAAERGEGSNAPVIAPFRRQEKVRAFSGTTHNLRRVVSSGEISPKFVEKSAPRWTSEAGVGLSEVTYSLQMGT